MLYSYWLNIILSSNNCLLLLIFVCVLYSVYVHLLLLDDLLSLQLVPTELLPHLLKIMVFFNVVLLGPVDFTLFLGLSQYALPIFGFELLLNLPGVGICVIEHIDGLC